MSEIAKAKIAVIDCDSGNLPNVCRALQLLGVDPVIVNSPEQLIEAEKIVLPGVGAYAHAMENLNRSGLAAAIRESAVKGTPVLGICLGMQLLFSQSHEFGITSGLDLISGEVLPLMSAEAEHTDVECSAKKVHIGWNELHAPKDGVHAYLGDVYFAHSYHAVPENSDTILARSDFNGKQFVAWVKQDNVCGLQFHPEKSGAMGLGILKQFIFNFSPELYNSSQLQALSQQAV